MQRLYPQDADEDTMAGDAAHWAGREVCEGRTVAEGQVAPNGVILTPEMEQGAELLAETVRGLTVPGDTVLYEQPQTAYNIHPQCWGTPDVSIWSPSRLLLHIPDYKFGHKFVDEYQNDQCVIYATGMLESMARAWGVPYGQLDQDITVAITIVQPRCYYRGAPVRTWTAKASDLRGQVNQLSAAAHEALEPNPRAVTNEGCDLCPGRHACPALQRASYAAAEVADRSAPVELTPTAASLELRMLERAQSRLAARVEGLQEQVTGYAKRGAVTPFHRLDASGMGNLKWSKPIPEVLAMGELFGVALGKADVITPTQAKAKGIDEAVIMAYSERPKGKIKLVPDNPTDARRVFN